MYLLGSDLKRPSYPTAKFSWSFADHTNSTAVMYVIYADHAKHRCTSCLPFCQKWCICALTLLMTQARTMSIVCWLLFLMAEERTMPSICYNDIQISIPAHFNRSTDHAKHRFTSCLPFCQKWCICTVTLSMAQAHTISIACQLLFLMAEEWTMPSICYNDILRAFCCFFTYIYIYYFHFSILFFKSSLSNLLFPISRYQFIIIYSRITTTGHNHK